MYVWVCGCMYVWVCGLVYIFSRSCNGIFFNPRWQGREAPIGVEVTGLYIKTCAKTTEIGVKSGVIGNSEFNPYINIFLDVPRVFFTFFRYWYIFFTILSYWVYFRLPYVSLSNLVSVNGNQEYFIPIWGTGSIFHLLNVLWVFSTLFIYHMLVKMQWVIILV